MKILDAGAGCGGVGVDEAQEARNWMERKMTSIKLDSWQAHVPESLRWLDLKTASATGWKAARVDLVHGNHDWSLIFSILWELFHRILY